MYEQMLRTLPQTAVGRGNSRILKPQEAWPGNSTAQNIVVVQWQIDPLEFDLAVVNLASHRSQGIVPLTMEKLADHHWLMKDLLGTEDHKRSGDELRNRGLYLDLPQHAAQLFHCALERVRGS
jgi:hypothetical protein